MSARGDASPRAFTMVEMLVVIFILLILLSIFVPYGLHVREQSRRIHCADNLRQIFGALQNYAKDNGSMFPRTKYDPATAAGGYKAFTGAESADPFAPDSPVEANDVTASYWLLLRIGYLTKSDYFVCDSDDAYPSRAADFKKLSNFPKRGNLSYSFAAPFSTNPEYKLTSDLPSAFVLAADLSPEGESNSLTQSEMNSENHGRAGQNVLYAYGAVEFKANPKCAINGDNIYTLRPHPATAPASAPATQPTAIDVMPWDSNDSYLVPKVSDRR